MKRDIRTKLHLAARRGTIDGHDALGVLMALGAEMVARVDADSTRAEFVGVVVENFEAMVELERKLPEEVQ